MAFTAHSLGGGALDYVVAITRSILPGVLFYILFNISGSLTNPDVFWDTVLASGMVIVLVPCIVSLHRVLTRLSSTQPKPRAGTVESSAATS